MWQLLRSEYEQYFYSKIRFFKKWQFAYQQVGNSRWKWSPNKKKDTKEKEIDYKWFFFYFNQLVGSLYTTVYTDLLEIVIISISRLVDFFIIGLSNPLKNSIKVLLQWHQWQCILHVQWKLMQSFRRKPFTDSIPGCNYLVLFFFTLIVKKKGHIVLTGKSKQMPFIAVCYVRWAEGEAHSSM